MSAQFAELSAAEEIHDSVVDRLARQRLDHLLDRLNHGRITISDRCCTRTFGSSSEGGLHATVNILRPRFCRRVLTGGSLGAAEAYLDGDWTADDLTGLIRILIRNMHVADGMDRGLPRLAGLAARGLHWWRRNTRSGSRRNIEAHYDLGNDFFRLFLDDTMMYSSGIFERPDGALSEASAAKNDRICRKLDLRPADHLLEIGTGWGGFALHAAGHYGCRVTTTTISREQHDLARQRVDAAGLGDRVQVLLQDYRELSGQYDKLVSIEMIEAVGYQYLDTYFRKCGELLRPEGSLLLQAIVMPERGYARYLQNVDFIQRYIFPGGCLPSLAALLESAGRTTDLRFVHAEDFAPHYAETLRRWRRAFHERLNDVRRLGYSEKFIRLWTYYLCYCEAVFDERHAGVLQIQLDKPQCRRDPIRLSERAAVAGPGPQPRPAAAVERELCVQGGRS